MIDLRILDAPGQREQLWPLSVEAYHTLGEAGLIPEKTELLRGFVFRKMPKSPFHRAILQRLLDRVNATLRKEQFWVQSEQPLTCEDSEPEPDLSVIRGSNEDFLERHPTTAELVIEIALHSREMDRAKAAIYAAAGVPEYWLVDVSSQTIEIRREPRAGSYTRTETAGAGEVAHSQTVPGLAVEVTALLAH